MKLILSILIAWIFTLFWVMKFNGYFDFWIVNLIDLDWTFEFDFSFIKYTLDYIFYIPELIFENEKTNIQLFFSEYSQLTNNETLIFIMFLFHLIITYLIFIIVSVFKWYKDKKIVSLLIISLYFLFIYIVQKII